MTTTLRTSAYAIIGFAAFGAMLFWPAGTFSYWQAWLFIGVWTLCTLVPSIYLLRTKPEALERRTHAGPNSETRPTQKAVITFLFLLVPAVMVFSAFDHRFGWSPVASAVSVADAVLMGIGLIVTQVVVIQNSYAAANVTVEAQQTVVSTGMYGAVRHPMYVGTVIMMAGIPLALGSYWGLLILAPGIALLAVRILDEEKMLRQDLAGYDAYTHQVRYRLVPKVW